MIGLTIYQGGAVGAAYLTAVFLSNLPEAISATTGLVTGGWPRSRVLWMWIAIVAVSGLASLGGYALFQESSPDTVAVVLAFAAGAILTILGEHDDARGVRAQRQAGRRGHDAGLRRAYAIHSLA